MRVLAVDYGERRVGLAVGELGSRLVLPRGVLVRKDDRTLIKDLVSLVREDGVSKIVVGDPLNMAGKPTKQTNLTRIFAEGLKEAAHVPVELVDERLTSQEADRSMGEATRSRDEVAAMRLLAAYLESRST